VSAPTSGCKPKTQKEIRRSAKEQGEQGQKSGERRFSALKKIWDPGARSCVIHSARAKLATLLWWDYLE